MKEEKIRKYFLGELDKIEAERFEEECSLDENLSFEARLGESELIDDYLRGALSLTEQKLFISNYLISEARRAKLGFSETLWENFKSQPVQIAEKKAGGVFSFRQNRMFLRTLLVGCSILILFCTCIYIWKSRNQNPEITRLEKSGQPPSKNTEIGSRI